MSDPRVVRTGPVLVWLLLASVVLLAAWLGWPERDEAAPPVVADRGAASGVEPPPRISVEPDIARAVVAEDEATPARLVEADLSHPFEHRLRVSLRDPFGFPVDGARVFVAPPRCTFSLWPQTSDAGGIVDLAWRSRQRVVAVQLAVVAWGIRQSMREVQVEADEPNRVTILVLGRQQSGARHTEMSRFELADAARKVRRARRTSNQDLLDELDFVCGRTMWEFKSHECTVCHDVSRLRGYGTLSHAAPMTAGLHPFASFQSLQRQPRSVSLPDERERQRGKRNDERRRRSRRPDGTRIVGRILGVDGKPAVDVPVAMVRDAEVVALTRTNTRGKYSLGPVPPGAAAIVAGGGRLGEVREQILVGRQRRLPWDAVLRAGETVSGTVVDAAGQPRPRWRVELHRSAGDYVGYGVTDSDGTFLVHGVPGPVECLVWPQASNSPFPLHHGTAAMVGAPPIRLAFDEQSPARAQLRVHAAVPVGFDTAAIDARLVQVETGRVAFANPVGFEQAFQVEPLSVGFYRMQIGCAGLGWDLSRDVFVDGRGLWDIGRLHLPSPVEVRFRVVGAVDPFAGSCEIYRRTAALDVRMAVERRGEVVRLPRDDYVLVWSHEGRVHAQEFTVEGGAEIVVEIYTGA